MALDSLITSPAEYVWQPPVYNLSNAPVARARTDLVPDEHFPENFARSARWYVGDSPGLTAMLVLDG